MVDRLAVLDNIPTRISFETMDATSARKQWWFLVQQVEHLPEALIAGREGLWLRHFLIGCPVLALWAPSSRPLDSCSTSLRSGQRSPTT